MLRKDLHQDPPHEIFRGYITSYNQQKLRLQASGKMASELKWRYFQGYGNIPGMRPVSRLA
jgi:hypothetical protein